MTKELHLHAICDLSLRTPVVLARGRRRVDEGTEHQPADLLGGRYEIGPLLGRGGMADVYRAQDHALDRPVAVKVLRNGFADESGGRRQSAEARMLGRLDHPNLVRAFDFGVDGGRYFLVMELVEGETLAAVIDRGAMPARRVAGVGRQLADGLAAIHQAGIVHRDVKPSNVLVTALEPASGETDATEQVRLTDFGIAVVVDATRLTMTGLMLGTALYLSPEQVLGGAVSYPSDVYSLGLLLLECLTATPTYPGTPVESAFARLHRQPEIPAQLGPAWVELLTAMTAREAVDRPTAAQAAGRLHALVDAPAVGPLTALPVAAAIAPPVRRPSHTTARRVTGRHSRGLAPILPPAVTRHASRRVGTAAGLAAAALAVAIVTGSVQHSSRPERQAEAVQQPTSGSMTSSAPVTARALDRAVSVVASDGGGITVTMPPLPGMSNGASARGVGLLGFSGGGTTATSTGGSTTAPTSSSSSSTQASSTHSSTSTSTSTSSSTTSTPAPTTVTTDGPGPSSPPDPTSSTTSPPVSTSTSTSPSDPPTDPSSSATSQTSQTSSELSSSSSSSTIPLDSSTSVSPA